jgi:hypothetical protein
MKTKVLNINGILEPQDSLEEWQRWMNWMQAKYWSGIAKAKRIEVIYEP